MRQFTLAAALVAMAAPSLAASSDYLLTLPPVKGELAGKGQEVPVQTFGWGKHSGHSMPGASDRPAAGSAAYGSMGRGLDIAVVDGQPPAGPGVLMVEGKLPGCAVGKRYSGAQFTSASMRYELKDVVISNCAADGMALDYGKVTVRGWNPETKQQ
jgi:hypothetical protein